MYGGGYIQPEENRPNAPIDDPQKLAEFDARIERGEKIEPRDWMPFEYRRQLIRMIEQHAHSEIMGALPEGTWITRAPGFRRKLAIMAKVQDEVGHGQLLYSAAETLGKTRQAMFNDLLSGKSKYSNVFNYPAETWADVTVIGFLIDAAAIVNQVANSKCSYGPYARALERICYEEAFHLKQGQDAFVALAIGSNDQREMLQQALNRWWKPIIHFFGPPDKESVHSEKLMRWKVKMASNDDMRNQFLSTYVPKIKEVDMIIPDPLLQKDDATGHWSFSDPDWKEFYEVINGNGPCNKERIAVRKWAQEKGRWIKQALYQANEKYTIPYA